MGWVELRGPEIVSELIEKSCSRSPWGGFGFSPFGLRQCIGKAVWAEGFDAGQQQEGVGCNLKLRHRVNRLRVSHLSLTDAEKRFLVTEVDFDVPTPEIVLEQLLDWEMRVGAK